MSSTETVYGQSLSLLPTPFIISLEDTETMCPKGNKGGKGSIMFSDMYTHTLFSTKKNCQESCSILKMICYTI